MLRVNYLKCLKSIRVVYIFIVIKVVYVERKLNLAIMVS